MLAIYLLFLLFNYLADLGGYEKKNSYSPEGANQLGVYKSAEFACLSEPYKFIISI